MRYDDIAAAYLEPSVPVAPGPVPSLPTGPARRLRDALEPIATHGWWNRRTNERLEVEGLDYMSAYVWGRAAGMGEPSAAVVVAAFGALEPGLVAAAYDRGRRAVDRDAVLAARQDGAVASLGELLGDVRARAGEVADVLFAACDGVDGAGRPLFSGLRSLPRPADELGRLWRAAELVREHRGDSHIAAWVARGRRGEEMNVLTELWLGMAPGSYSATRGFPRAAVAAAVASLEAHGLVADGALTAEGRELRDDIEAATDAAQAELVGAIGGDLEGIVAATGSWSQRVIDARLFPPDPLKRAAG